MERDQRLLTHPDKAIDYSEYFRILERHALNPALNENMPWGGEKSEFIRLNYQRSRRIQKTYGPSRETLDLLKNLNQSQTWIVMSEIWCGDSAQILPVLARLAEESGNINLKILFRYENPELMDRFLTDGKRSIPKLLALDEKGELLFKWGPRPRMAADLFRSLKAEGLEKDRILMELHKWYTKDRGISVEKELCAKIGFLQQVARVES